MANYVTMIRFAQQGIQNIKESPARLEAAKSAFREAGAEFKQFFLLIGQYDAMCVCEAPDDETIAKVMLAAGAQGNVRTETYRAFTEDEYRNIISELPA